MRPVTVNCGTAKFDLTLSLQDTEQGLLATVEYNTDLFDHTTIIRMLSHFQTLLEGIIADPEQRLADIPLLMAAERQQLLVEWNATPTDYPQDTCLHQLFEAQMERRPDAVAVVCEGSTLTYSSPEPAGQSTSRSLRVLGVGPEVCVGLCMERSLEMVVGLLGILKAGGAYVPLDPTYPTERLGAMMAEARVAVLVTQQQHMAGLSVTDDHVVCLDDGVGTCGAAERDEPSQWGDRRELGIRDVYLGSDWHTQRGDGRASPGAGLPVWLRARRSGGRRLYRHGGLPLRV